MILMIRMDDLLALSMSVRSKQTLSDEPDCTNALSGHSEGLAPTVFGELRERSDGNSVNNSDSPVTDVVGLMKSGRAPSKQCVLVPAPTNAAGLTKRRQRK